MMIIPDPTWDGTAVVAIAARMDDKKQRKWMYGSGRVFFKHRRAQFHLKEMQLAVEQMVESMQPVRLELAEQHVHSSYSGPLSETLHFHIDGFFEATRASHDALIALLVSADVVKHDAKPSIHAFVGQIRKGSDRATTSPPEVGELVERFWTTTGETARDYRDCLTHYISFSGPNWQSAVMMLGRAKGWTPWVPLPDNPKSRSNVEFIFDKRLDALRYCESVYEDFDSLLKEVASHCQAKWTSTDGKDDTKQPLRKKA